MPVLYFFKESAIGLPHQRFTSHKEPACDQLTLEVEAPDGGVGQLRVSLLSQGCDLDVAEVLRGRRVQA